jgi:hypothetical protein
MTNTKQRSAICAGMCPTERGLGSFKGEAELEKLDRQSGLQYIPMDVYVDPQTIKERFQASSSRKRWARK